MSSLAKEISSCYIRCLLAAPPHACIFSGDVPIRINGAF
jgi:hypothetical protein